MRFLQKNLQHLYGEVLFYCLFDLILRESLIFLFSQNIVPKEERNGNREKTEFLHMRFRYLNMHL